MLLGLFSVRKQLSIVVIILGVFMVPVSGIPAEFVDSGRVNRRERWKFRADLPSRDSNLWKDICSRNYSSKAPYYVSGNMVVYGQMGPNFELEGADFRYCSPSAPGLLYTTIYPATTWGDSNDRLGAIVGAIVFKKKGIPIKLAWQPKGRKWRPYVLEESYSGGGLEVDQKITVWGADYADVAVCKLEISGPLSDIDAFCTGSLFRGGEAETRANYVIAQITEEAEDFVYDGGPRKGQKPRPSKALGTYAAFSASFATNPESYRITGTPKISYTAEGPARKTIYLIFAAGYEYEEIVREITGAISDPEQVFKKTEQDWNDYFSRIVPVFRCSDRNYERFYYETFMTGKLSTYDCPYEPFIYPFNIPAGKTIKNWRMQFQHDSMFGSRSFLWLNDPERCKCELLQMLEGGMPGNWEQSGLRDGKFTKGRGTEVFWKRYFPFSLSGIRRNAGLKAGLTRTAPT